MLGIRIDTGIEGRVSRPKEDLLRHLVEYLGRLGYSDFSVDRIGSPDSVVLRHKAADHYVLERANTDTGRRYAARLDDTATAVRVMTRWARQTPGWDDGLAFEYLGPGEEPAPDFPEDYPREWIDRLEAEVRDVLVTGYASRRELIQIATDYSDSVEYAQARQLVNRLWRERLDAEADWEDVTAPDRIEDLFARLYGQGIIAREDFSCCRGCGESEIRGVAARHGARRGYVFFHRQASLRVASTGLLSLYYGSFDDSDETTTAVGHEVAEAFRTLDLPVEWNGSPDAAIVVGPLEWHKRLPQ